MTASIEDADTSDGRDESPNERYDRNWGELLQEFRVMQTGTQILAGFLLTLPFQRRFAELDSFQIGVYLVLVFLAAAITLLALAPVSVHRLLFRRKAKAALVSLANRILILCLAAGSLLFAGITLFVFGFVLDHEAGLIAGGCVFVIILIIWVLIPLGMRHNSKKRSKP